MLCLEQVSFWYNTEDPPTVYNCSFTVGPSEFVAVVGESGGGKTTILRLACGLMQRSLGYGGLPDASYVGNISFGARPITGPDENFGYVPQNFTAGLYPKQTALGNVLLGVSESGISAEEEELGKNLLVLAQMNDVADVNVRRLSGGQQQRVAICRALVKEPRVLFMDEPFANIDTTRRQGMANLLRSLREGRDSKAHPLSALVVTHDLEGAIDFADKILAVRTWYHGPEYRVFNRADYSDKSSGRLKIEQWLIKKKGD
ncbi:MAG TPA: ATP-binding cassette domain-containing protein [Chthoniobacterales bacterium]|nr:ATP-binding cassette domain-containing protein [Chthoniobacterales bacterium]